MIEELGTYEEERVYDAGFNKEYHDLLCPRTRRRLAEGFEMQVPIIPAIVPNEWTSPRI